jgi:hypothetical protein
MRQKENEENLKKKKTRWQTANEWFNEKSYNKEEGKITFLIYRIALKERVVQ